MFNFLRFLSQHWKRILFRAHKDKRSLAALLTLLGIIAYCAYYGFLLLKNPLSLVILGLGAVVAWRMRKSYEKDDDSLLRLSDYPSVTPEPSDTAIASLRSETIRLWLLFWRASSEQFLAEKSLPDGTEVTTRRTVLNKLDELGLREPLTETELTLHLAPNGAWSKESIMGITVRAAELEALQYSCGVIGHLSPIEDFYRLPKVDIERLLSTTNKIEWRARETFDIRRERDAAAAFCLRCFGEQIRRGIVDKSFNEEQQNILRASNASAGDPNSDFLIGTQIISEVAAEKLNIATEQAHLRFATLQHALTVLESSS